MTLTAHKEEIKKWMNRTDYTDANLVQFTRLGEERLNQSLRIKDMIQIDTAFIEEDNRRVLLPSDWQELDFVQDLEIGPIEFIDRTEFYRRKPENCKGYYTISGNYVIFGGPINSVSGNEIELHYYGNVPPLGDNPTWLYTLYPSLQLWSSLVFANLFGFDNEASTTYAGLLKGAIDTANELHLKSKASGSRLHRKRPRSYG
ncbi:virion structural protein [Ochrobactrum phage vB_OspP_OH]|uniref:Tail tubular protein A n=1 Tax=Ochrobactrum phage vB_OspP_OH TaxID=2712957 RepID=A0A6G6XXP6_9CAUD|nr:virion structural protein [Ochrobactrum phage vB_OspP_OH]QIG66104.1 tail tubular protein A [Ochrobactrum phage vB_OspP_OH]